MASFNKVMGNLTHDPQSGLLPESQTPVCDFGLAVNRTWKDGKGQTREEVLFIDCTAFGKTAQSVGEYLKKGRAVHVEGHLKLDRWDQEGQKRSKIRVTVEQVRFVGSSPVAKPNRQQRPTPARNAKGQQANRLPM
jgi:single-strand DNA-binding protein